MTDQLDQARASHLTPDQAELAIAELSRQLDLRDRSLALTIADRDRVLALVQEIMATTSWKVTAPLRRLKGLLRRGGPA